MSLSIVGLPIDDHDSDAQGVALVATEWGAIGALAAVSTAPAHSYKVVTSDRDTIFCFLLFPYANPFVIIRS